MTKPKPVNDVAFNLTEEEMAIIGAGLQILGLNLEQMVLYFPDPVDIYDFKTRLGDLQDKWDLYRDALEKDRPLYN